MEEATYWFGALLIADVMALAVSLNRAPQLIHLEKRSLLRNRYIGGRPEPQTCVGNSASGFHPFVSATSFLNTPPWTN